MVKSSGTTGRNVAGTPASFEEFQAEHRADHQSAFNRWCAAVGNPVYLVGVAALLMRRWRTGAALFIGGTGLTAVEGNLPSANRALARHPIWAVRADVILARDILVGRLQGRSSQ